MGFDQTILGQISHLRDVLQRYHGFAVIRELIQNADDAQATRLDIGCVGPLSDADHPLLRGGPSLFVVNDGPFTASNARSIAQLGLSDKAGGTGSIGKFGLGLKSILHFGEVYFFLSSATFDAGDPDAEYKSSDVQNPWHDRRSKKSFYPDWNEFKEADRGRIVDRLGPLLASPNWFCLVVPLRRKPDPRAGATRAMDQLRVIATEYPGDARAPASLVFPADFEVEVARLLPLLRNLRTVRGWDEEAGRLRPLCGLSLDWPHQRSRAAATILGGRDPLGGVIRVDRREPPGSADLTFAGFESYLDHAPLANLARRDDWPGSIILPDPERPGEGPDFRPEEPVAHAAACFGRIPAAGPGRLEIRWASYLPVQQPEREFLGLGSSDDVTLTLHGRFFVDAGRVAIDFGDPDVPRGSRHVRQQWNDTLRDDGTLDLVIPALEEFAGRLAPGEPAGLVRELTGALRRSSLFEEHRDAICRRHQWAYLVGRDGAAWTRIEGDGRLHAVPEPGATDPPLADVFPRLPSLGREDFRLTYRDWPGLRRSDDLLPWPENALLRLLETDQSASFRDPARMGLVVRTLRGALPSPPQPAVVDRLVSIARAELKALAWGELARLRETIKPFLDLIPAGRKLAVDLRNMPGAVASPLLRALWGLERPPLVVPFGAGEARPGAMEREEMVGCLLALDPVGPADEFLGARADLACQVVRAGGGDLGAAWAGLDDRAIFPATAGGDGAPALATRAELATALRGSRLFVDRLGLAGALRDSLEAGAGAGPVLTITRPLADACFGGGVVPDADARSCLVALATLPTLVRQVEPRVALAERLLENLGPAGVAAHRAAFRYLLHGDPARAGNDAPLLFEAGAAAATAWAELARRALRQDDGGWRVIPRALAEPFNTAQRATLGVAALDRPGVVGMLRVHDPGRLDLADLTDDDVRALIEEAAPADFDVIRALPIHQGRAGRRVAIDERCRWEGDFPVAADLAEGVVILVPHSNRVVAERQREIHPPTLDARGAIDLILKHPEPSRFGPTVIAALDRVGQIPSNHSVALRSTRWVATTEGRAVAPSQVVRLSFNDDAVAAALAAVDRDAQDVVSILELAEPFRKSLWIPRLSPQPGDALDRLGRCLGRDSRYRVGNLLRDQVRLDALRTLFRDAPSGVMSCMPVLADDLRRAATRDNIDTNLGASLLPQLLGPIPSDRLRSILRFLADAHRTAPAAEKDRYLDGYCRYLEAAARTDQILEIMREIPLLNQIGAWTPANRLAMGATNVHAASLLDGHLAEILAEHAAPHDRVEVGATPAGSAGVMAGSLGDEAERAVGPLRDYLEEWAALPNVNRELVGGLLALLGDGPGLTTLAGQFLGNFDRAELRDQLHWRSDAAWIDKDGAKRGGAGRNLADLMRARRVIVELGDGDQIAVTNLLGEPISVYLNSEYADLLLPHVDLGLREGHEYLRLRLRRVSPRHLPGHLDAAAVLRRTARRLLEVVDRQHVANFDQIWDRLTRSEQLDLDVAREVILDGLVHLLHTLELRHQPPLAAPLKRYHEANRVSVQVKAGDTKRRDEVERRKQIELIEILRLVEDDPEAQAHCLAAVRAKLQRYEYQPESIPFELFQNADDAAVELRELLGPGHPPDPATRRFVAAAAGSTVWFAAWGRAINRHQFAGFDGSARGFDQDLEKMLTLNWSDKGRHDGTTGKFGLGFKSVLLASDRPRVVSDRLAFEVAGGLLPARMVPERAQALRDRLQEYEPSGSAGTIVELPLAGASADQVLKRFQDLSPLLPVFAREIRDCRVPAPDGRDVAYRWEPTVLGDHLEVGDVRDIGRLLVLRGETAKLALLVDADGIGKLPDRFPTIWVTAPTRHEAKLGFALNAPFTLDVGRSQLARDSEANDEVADRAGIELGAALLDLFHQADADWPAFQHVLGLRPGLTQAAFWQSLWDRLGRSLLGVADPLGPLLHRVFWDAPDRGMRHLIAEAAALPTGLPGLEGGLTRLDLVQGVVVGLLLNETIAREVALWPHAATFPAGSLIAERICEDLSRLKVLDKARIEAISMAPLIDRALGSSLHVTVDFAHRFGRLVSLPAWVTWQREDEGSRTPTKLRERLNQIRFLARDGSWHPAVDLLVDGDEEEGLQAGFAPDRAILHRAYTAEGIACFRACRPTPRTSAASLKQWAVSATGAARGAVLAYLDRGRLGRDLAEELRGGSHWLAGLDDRSALSYGLDPHQVGVVLGRLRIDPQKAPAPRPAPPPPSAGKILNEIHEWWTENREVCVEAYEREWYPEARFPTLSPSMGRNSPPDDRKGWMVLLMLGAMHTMGRTRAAAHSGFLRRCEREGWLDTFSGPTTRLELWMEVLVDYLNKNVADSPYLQWMGRFTSIFQLAHWLPEYVESYLAIERFKQPFEMDEILNLRTSARQSGSGRDAPPLSRTLGIGACFVVRELVRNGQLGDSHAHPHCYVPTARVRRLLTMLGCPGLEDGYRSAAERVRASQVIHRFLVAKLGAERATFHGDFDLPLQILTGKHRARLEEILNVSLNGELDHDDDALGEAF